MIRLRCSKSLFRRWAPVLIAGLLAIQALPVGAQTASIRLADRVKEHRLENGLRLLMVERHAAPVVSLNITYAVGGVNEHPGNTGIAHFYEHLAFKGTRTLGTHGFREEAVLLKQLDQAWAALQAERDKGEDTDHNRLVALEARFRDLERKCAERVVPNEVPELYERNGAAGLNATTSKDLTRYMVSLPSNRLELWAAIESDRMANSVIREFYKEKDVVLEERRLRYENSPSGRLYEAFLSTAFTAHPYGMPVIGWTRDLERLSRPETEAFFKSYYGPQNAVIAIVGDIDVNKTVRMIETFFGRIPAQPHPPSVRAVEPPPPGERRVQVEFEAEPSLIIGYAVPSLNHPDDPVFDVIDGLLSDGRSSRLYRALVQEQGLAASVSTSSGVPGVKYPHQFMIQAVPRAPHGTEDLERAIEVELNRLKTEPAAPHDLQKVLNQLDAAQIRGLESNSGLASQLGYFETVAGDWRYILKNRERVAHVTAGDVMRVAREYFVKNNRTVATLSRKKND
ncbi:MAG TPA: pitrilysin family protein [Nitrospiria bacterium]